MGLLDPETSDGRIIFFLPWERYTIAGQNFIVSFNFIVCPQIYFYLVIIITVVTTND